VIPIDVVHIGAKRRWLSHYKSSGRHGNSRAELSLRISRHFRAVGIVNDAIEDSVPDRWVGEAGKPIGNRDLGGHQSGDPSKTVIEDFEEVLSVGGRDRVAQPVVQNEQVQLGQTCQEGGIRAILVDWASW